MIDTYSKNDGVNDQSAWYAIRTFNCQEFKISKFLESKKYDYFIPMTFSDKFTDEEMPKRMLTPAVRNLIFLKKTAKQSEIATTLSECETPISVLKKLGSNTFCEIPAKDMLELRTLCDPKFTASIFMTQAEADVMIGKEVKVVAGPFNGCIGRLVRKDKKYYLLKSVIGMGVMVHVSRWYCEPI
ncbi:MAG: UpxY family transcription antiterminator [Muribaculaceae bacterium]